MISNQTDRLAVVRELLDLSIPLKDAVSQLATIDWDYDGNGVELKARHVAMALQRYLRGELSKTDVEDWANHIEGREDVQFETGSEQKLENVIYELANPTLTKVLDQARAKLLIEQLSMQ